MTPAFLQTLENYLEQYPMASQLWFSLQLNCSEATIQRGIRDLGFTPYKLRKFQRLKARHIELRLDYCQRMLLLGRDFLKTVWFTPR